MPEIDVGVLDYLDRRYGLNHNHEAPKKSPEEGHADFFRKNKCNFGDCAEHGRIQNQGNFVRKLKTCNNCSSNSQHPDNKHCSWCGSTDFDNDDGIELDDDTIMNGVGGVDPW